MAAYKGIKAVLRQFYVLIKQKLDSIKVDADHFEGTLPVSKGGTGVTSQADINKSFIGNLDVGESDVTDGTEFVSSWASDNGFSEPEALNKPYKRKFSKVWNYIQGKISSVLGLTKDNYNGNAKTASYARKAVADEYGHDIFSTYATIKDTRVWNCLYSGSYRSNGYFELVTIQGYSPGNHDVGIKGTCFIDKTGLVSEVAFSAYVRGRGSVVNLVYFTTQRIGFSHDYSHLLIATYSTFTHQGKNYYSLTIYGKIEQNYQRFNTCIDYASTGDVSDRLDLSKLTFRRAFVTKLDGTVISRRNLNDLVVPTSAPSSPVEGQIWIG